jgi:uncharacterized protein YigE (DUF2233 family)
LKRRGKIFFGSLLILLISGFYAFNVNSISLNDRILAYSVDTKKQNLQFYWKNDSGEIFGSIQNLKNYVESKNLTLNFAMNGGMYMEDLNPLGLYIQEGKKLNNINKAEGSGNFYLKPNGIFCITNDNVPFVCKTSDFVNKNIKYATQSGPMLVIDGQIHSAFKKGSTNLNIRNGVGILPNNKAVFAISKTAINFYDFAKYFQQLGCKNALYLDGFVSRMYLPEKKWIQTDGDFGVIIGVTSKQNNISK